MSRKRKQTNTETNISQQDDNERYFLDPEAVSRHLFCSICQEVFTEPQRAPCGHSFCKECILTWLKHKKNCPEDRRPLKSTDLHYDFIVANVIGDHTVACPFRRRGCEFLGKLEILSSHRKSCVFNPNNLPSFLHKERAALAEVQPSTSGTSVPTPEESGPLLTSHDDSPDMTEKLPTPAKPSLAMRLFCKGGGQRDLLCTMFDKDGAPSSSSTQPKPTPPPPRSRRKGKENAVIILDTP